MNDQDMLDWLTATLVRLTRPQLASTPNELRVRAAELGRVNAILQDYISSKNQVIVR
jgi:hypothetical protein